MDFTNVSRFCWVGGTLYKGVASGAHCVSKVLSISNLKSTDLKKKEKKELI